MAEACHYIAAIQGYWVKSRLSHWGISKCQYVYVFSLGLIIFYRQSLHSLFWGFVWLSVDWDLTVGSLVQNGGFHEFLCFEYGHTLACNFSLCLQVRSSDLFLLGEGAAVSERERGSSFKLLKQITPLGFKLTLHSGFQRYLVLQNRELFQDFAIKMRFAIKIRIKLILIGIILSQTVLIFFPIYKCIISFYMWLINQDFYTSHHRLPWKLN